jgi:DNA topoisomerase-1
MTPALYATTSVDVGAGRPDVAPVDRKYLFRATGSVVRFDGFMRVWGSSEDDRLLPEMEAGTPLDLLQLSPEQHFTQPPPRYSEASLVRALEENGIGRPSTYAPILSTIQQRGYVALEERRFYPTELGFIVNDLLVEYFSDVLNIGFTARMEEQLDEVARGERDWVPVLESFYGPFSDDLERAEREMENIEIEDEEIGEDCPECGSPLILRLGRYGRFVGCSNFPECRYTRQYQELIGVECPDCGGDLVVKRTRSGRTFYGCTNYPECEYASWKRPLPVRCPQCSGLLVQSGRDGAQCTDCGERFGIDELPRSEAEAATAPKVPAAEVKRQSK